MRLAVDTLIKTSGFVDQVAGKIAPYFRRALRTTKFDVNRYANRLKSLVTGSKLDAMKKSFRAALAPSHIAGSAVFNKPLNREAAKVWTTRAAIPAGVAGGSVYLAGGSGLDPQLEAERLANKAKRVAAAQRTALARSVEADLLGDDFYGAGVRIDPNSWGGSASTPKATPDKSFMDSPLVAKLILHTGLRSVFKLSPLLLALALSKRRPKRRGRKVRDAMQLIKTSGIFTDTLMDIRDTVDYAKNYWLPEGSTQRLMASDLKNKTVEGLKLMDDNPKTTAGEGLKLMDDNPKTTAGLLAGSASTPKATPDKSFMDSPLVAKLRDLYARHPNVVLGGAGVAALSPLLLALALSKRRPKRRGRKVREEE
jgi:hypothetical protein